jgi:hypothetical protein
MAVERLAADQLGQRVGELDLAAGAVSCLSRWSNTSGIRHVAADQARVDGASSGLGFSTRPVISARPSFSP